MTIFVDTSAFYAQIADDDQSHLAALAMWSRLSHEHVRLMTTSYVALESCALLQSRFGMKGTRALVYELLPVVDIEFVGPRTHQMAVDTLLTANRRDLSLVDCVSFLVMREQRIDRVFTFDRHFAEQGFTLLAG
jgi:predicted nucleic acid-binding protein